MPVAVDIAGAGAHAVLMMADSRALGDIHEDTGAAVVIQPMLRAASDGGIGERPAVKSANSPRQSW